MSFKNNKKSNEQKTSEANTQIYIDSHMRSTHILTIMQRNIPMFNVSYKPKIPLYRSNNRAI